jgi:hypothetical protein
MPLDSVFVKRRSGETRRIPGFYEYDPARAKHPLHASRLQWREMRAGCTTFVQIPGKMGKT